MSALTADSLLGGVFTFKLKVSDGVYANQESVSFDRVGVNVPDCRTIKLCPLTSKPANPLALAMRQGGAREAMVVWAQGINNTQFGIFKSEFRSGVWTHPSSLTDKLSPTSGGSDPNGNPSLAMDNQGNAIVVWQQKDGAGDSQIFKAEYRSGVWSKPTGINDNISPDGTGAEEPRVVMDTNGNALIVWWQIRTGIKRLFKSEYRNGVWTHPASINDTFSLADSDIIHFHSAMDNNGNALIVWTQDDGFGFSRQVYKSEFRSGAWVHPTTLANNLPPNGDVASTPQIAMDDAGNAIIVWTQQSPDAGNGQVFKSEYRGGAWVHSASTSSYISLTGSGSSLPQVAMDHQGNALIVWRQRNASNKTMVYKSEYRQGLWDHPNDFSESISPTHSEVSRVKLAMDTLGNAVLLWEQLDTMVLRTWLSEYRVSSGQWVHPTGTTSFSQAFGGPIQLGRSRVAMDNLGNSVVVWSY
jgi:mRNA-degrading endonuclease HigB of HigAB toxin-antitoxin module